MAAVNVSADICAIIRHNETTNLKVCGEIGI